MNQLASVKICEVATIHSKVREKKNNVTFFVDPLSVLMECDQRLAMNQQHYFEDVIIDFEKIILALSQDSSITLASWYSSRYGTDKTMDDLIEIMKKYNDKWTGKYYIYRKICKNVGFIILETKGFKVFINKTKNLKFYDDLLKHFQVAIIVRKKCGYNEEHIEMIVHNNFN